MVINQKMDWQENIFEETQYKQGEKMKNIKNIFKRHGIWAKRNWENFRANYSSA